LVEAQVEPPGPSLSVNSIDPSAEETTVKNESPSPAQFVPVGLAKFQLLPESVEIQAPPTPPAINLVPSAEEARDNQELLGAMLCNHEVPESLERQIPPPFTAAVMLTPFVEEAMADQLFVGASL
jgi:hypothetical protein